MTDADPSVETSHQVASASSPAATILVVDDERPLREMVVQALEDVGYFVLQGFHGNHALEIIARHRPDLLISDVMMPLMGGIELCRRLKSDAATANIPVILMSAAGLHMAGDAGADALLAKPFELDTMDALVHRLLRAASGQR